MKAIGLALLIGAYIFLGKKAKEYETAGSSFSPPSDEGEGEGKVRVVGEDGGGRGVSRPTSGETDSIHVSHEPTLTVERNTQPLWKSKGWRKANGKYVGNYEVNGKKYKGEACKKTRYFKFYVHDLPSSVKNGSHGACFRRRNGKYWIHFKNKPKELSSGILAVEETMKNSMN